MAGCSTPTSSSSTMISTACWEWTVAMRLPSISLWWERSLAEHARHKLNRQLDEAPACEKLKVVVVRARDELKILGVAGRFVQTSALRRWDDAVVVAGND